MVQNSKIDSRKGIKCSDDNIFLCKLYPKNNIFPTSPITFLIVRLILNHMKQMCLITCHYMQYNVWFVNARISFLVKGTSWKFSKKFWKRQRPTSTAKTRSISQWHAPNWNPSSFPYRHEMFAGEPIAPTFYESCFKSRFDDGKNYSNMWGFFHDHILLIRLYV